MGTIIKDMHVTILCLLDIPVKIRIARMGDMNNLYKKIIYDAVKVK